MSRSADLKQGHHDAWERVVRHPFVLALGDGSLPRPVFAAYMAQDYLFVDALTRTVAYGIAKAPAAAKPLGDFLQTLLGAEDDLFRRVFAELHMPSPAISRPEPLPITERFGSFLVRLGRRGTFEQIATALFVTEGTYADWASRLAAEGRRPSDALYRDWIDIHADASLKALVDYLSGCMGAATGDSSEQELDRVFRQALRYELAFWNAFYPTRGARGRAHG